ncbi:MAG TPA: alpha/beta hydrolase-fold protein [Caproicibacter sp.]|nr:alpha/beta hydrolase-fold protein [Caproicibacter sp.]
MNGKSKNIVIADFYSKELNNYRNIRIYLPQSYETELDKRYPVLYMHDGQNLFDPADSPFKTTWNVHKTVDKLANDGKMKAIIVVGIDNNANRGSEYCHFMPEGRMEGRRGFRKCKISKEARGILYERFIINSLKPYIDAHFRTLKDRDNTALMGSSLGGLVTYFIGFRHPEIFSKLGILSPAFNWADFEKLNDVQKEPLKIWMDTGEGEAYYVENSRKVVNSLLEKGFVPEKDLAYFQVPGAIHNEDCWAKRLRMPLLFFFGNIGKPVSCSLTGRKRIGLKGMDVTVNPIVKYDSGFIMTDINGKFTIENPDILEIEPNGRIIPKACGTTNVKYEKYGLMDNGTYEIINELSETVKLELDIKVPSNTPTQERIFVNVGEIIEATKDKNGIYKCIITVPRDWGYHYNILMGDAHIRELDVNGKPVENIFQATDNMKIQYTVEKWDFA